MTYEPYTPTRLRVDLIKRPATSPMSTTERARLGEDAYAAVYAEGRALALEDAGACPSHRLSWSRTSDDS